MKNLKNPIRWCVGMSLWLAVGCTAMERELEPLYGIVLNKGNVRVQVNSNGCTDKHSFKIEVEKDQLAVYRIKPDFCRRRSFRVWIDFPKHVRTEGLTLVNPIRFFDKAGWRRSVEGQSAPGALVR